MKDIIFVIFGSTGDLTSRKLLPALSKLYTKKQINQNMMVIALGRRDFTTDDYLDYVIKTDNNKLDKEVLKSFVTYYEMQITEPNDYKGLKAYIETFSGPETKQLFYMAVAPQFFDDVAKHLSDADLVQKGEENHSLIFEKPFGVDLESAKSINQMLWKYFDERQIYRIDHYLGKEMIQNILMVRFANRIFEEVWHNRTIKNVKLIVKETDGILGRAGYYDESGALKDMVQSHLLQMLSMVAMDTPVSFYSEDVKNEKVEVLRHLTFDKHSMILGQYDGYKQEKDIDETSNTDTFVFLKTFVNTPRFKGVPFYLLTGKKLDTKESMIIVEFEETLEQKKWDLPLATNKLYIKIAPLDGFGLSLNSKVPGLSGDLESVELEYCVACKAYGNMSEAYEKLLLDASEHHKTLFTRWDEIELSWKFIDEVKKVQKAPVIYKDFQQLKALILEQENEEF
ncbi:MAG: glucose-6-phosphate dehydrogenase [Acholeplasmataceae bacterium]